MKIIAKIFKNRSTPLAYKRRSVAEKSVFIAVFILFAIYTVTIILFFGWAFLSSFKTNREFFADSIKFPAVWRIENYVTAFRLLNYNNTNFLGMIFNSLWLTVGGTVISIFMHCVTGYIFAKYNFKGKYALLSIVIFTMIIPIVGNLPAMYRLIYTLGINDSPLFLVVHFGGAGANLLIMMAFFKGISWSFAESAFIDGATHYQTFFKIMLPMAKGPSIALGVVALISGWNDYMTPILYLDKMPTLATGLYYYRQELQWASNEPVYFAGVIMSMIPVLVLFTAFSNKIMGSVVLGGLKG